MMEQEPEIAENTPAVRNLAPSDERDAAHASSEEQKKHLQEVVHKKTHALARCFLEVDADYKQFTIGSRMRATAAERLNAQQAYYNEGRITIDRLLDAVSQYVTAMATEFQSKVTYNIALTCLSEAKGTLLADRGIAVADAVEGSHTRPASDAKVQAVDADSTRSPGGRGAADEPIGPMNVAAPIPRRHRCHRRLPSQLRNRSPQPGSIAPGKRTYGRSRFTRRSRLRSKSTPYVCSLTMSSEFPLTCSRSPFRMPEPRTGIRDSRGL